ncbi:ATP-grasp domain-containing protein [Nocardioides sp. cx-173]|uniref:acetyl/propionyl/methylcrotonyl-CoA carboxylase subunit alpha n=1 Tax=Nocardioides sp. cx-173 TaxID=2898796 RepID=UPI001E4FE1C5|nr:biotin carboxylase N-terminal domain-containing protein [Nocardioides sp. cx-173]MCD4523873.1 ATP-grasp domain-containing protein [Nocardioides sp. cx-173]UGB41808.1 ATP-grasp domain-containing protein [Nocardioides sp. cx-173]
MPTISRVLVANRAEIASRVFRTCRDLGIETVAVHSDADAALPYVAEADHAVRLPGTAPADTYLRADLVLDAARRTGADAVHPGYGFLSENADFARAVAAAGLTWIGPAPASIEQMGSKIESKKLMEAAGVPVLTNHSVDTATDADLPLLVKASAGGGGRGMRVVRSLADLPGEIEKARAEAESAFGDGTVFVEPYIEQGRHVEVQVLGHGEGVEVYGERDCSIQRRHQKVVEEAPAPLLPEPTRRALHEAARAAAAAIDYRGAGTVEFLYDAERDRFFFLEMNTRLQVEHPVTEEVFGVDLVAQQIAVAEDEAVAGAVRPEGHAIEVRLYAEDPSADYQPQSGLLTSFEIPVEDGIRVESGFASGNEVSTHYDAMLAKVIAHAGTRQAAARKLASVLSRARIHGLVTNRDLLVAILRDETFLSGQVSTAFLGGFETGLRSSSTTEAAAVAAAVALAERAGAARTVQSGAPVGWRNVTSQPQRTEFEGDLVVEWLGGRDGYVVDGHVVVTASPTSVTLETDGVRTTYDVAVSGLVVDVDSTHGHVRLERVPRFVDPADAVASGSLLAPMPGTVVRVVVEPGATVAAGDPVLVLEAMKMQHTVSAPHDGTVAEIHVQPGTQVAAGEVLAVVETGEDA